MEFFGDAELLFLRCLTLRRLSLASSRVTRCLRVSRSIFLIIGNIKWQRQREG